jgi:hypothetical protein
MINIKDKEADHRDDCNGLVIPGNRLSLQIKKAELPSLRQPGYLQLN